MERPFVRVDSAGSEARVGDWIDDIVDAVSVVSAPGREEGAVAHVKCWAAAREWCEVRSDAHGNLHVRSGREPKGKPLYFCAHLDHPGFIVELVHDSRVDLIFRGATGDSPLIGEAVRISTGGGSVRAVIEGVNQRGAAWTRVTARCDGVVQAGDLGAWDIGASAEEGEEVRGLACDDMAGVGACLRAFENLRTREPAGPVRLVFTRAEEMGMLGAMGVCRAGLLGEGARVVCVDACEGPGGGGVLAPDGDGAGWYTRGLVRELRLLGANDGATGAGATEAGVFTSYGHEAAALLFAVRGMHNRSNGVLCAERVSTFDLRRVVEVLVAAGEQLSRGGRRAAMDDHWREWSSLLGEP